MAVLAREDGVVDLALTSNLELANEVSPATQKLLIANAASISFSYFGKGRSDRGAEWRTLWAGELLPPKLVRIQVKFRAGDTRDWPELIIARRISQSPVSGASCSRVEHRSLPSGRQYDPGGELD